MRHVKEVIVVEGRYDKNTVAQVVSGAIIETSGFGILKSKEKIDLLRTLAKKNGLIILTDSDKAGFFIRGRLQGMLNDINVKHAYIPDIKGFEKRKNSPSKEGKLGVEGMTRDVILKSLEMAGATFVDSSSLLPGEGKITKADLFAVGLSGRENSALNRREFLKQLGLPERLSTNGLLDVLNVLYTKEEILRWNIDELFAMDFSRK